MTREEILEFDRVMKSYYRNKAYKLDDVNRVLWDIAFDLVRAIAASELDGSGINSLKKIGEAKADDLKELIDTQAGP